MIEERHRLVDALSTITFDSIDCRIKHGLQFAFFFENKLSKYEIHLTAFGETTVANTYSQSGIIVGCQRVIDVFQTIVTTVTALFPHAQCAKRQCKIVHHYYEILFGQFILLEPVIDSLDA